MISAWGSANFSTSIFSDVRLVMGSAILRETCGGDVDGVAEAEAFVDAAAEDEVFDGFGNVDEAAASFDFEPEVFG
jgi:hypothetical protein